jgi:hypothetical protein
MQNKDKEKARAYINSAIKTVDIPPLLSEEHVSAACDYAVRLACFMGVSDNQGDYVGYVQLALGHEDKKEQEEIQRIIQSHKKQNDSKN